MKDWTAAFLVIVRKDWTLVKVTKMKGRISLSVLWGKKGMKKSKAV